MIRRKFYGDFRKSTSHSRLKFLDEKCVLFLDIDGVLQPTWSDSRFDYDLDALQKAMAEFFDDERYLKIDKYDIGAVFYDWDFVSIGYLKQLLIDFDMDIVLHSSWINYRSLEEMKCLFRIHQLDDYVIDMTAKTSGIREDGTYPTKTSVIKDYLEAHPDIQRYVVIDDDSSVGDVGEQFVYAPNKIDDETYLKMREKIFGKEDKEIL